MCHLKKASCRAATRVATLIIHRLARQNKRRRGRIESARGAGGCYMDWKSQPRNTAQNTLHNTRLSYESYDVH
eukprot:3767442-Amphidinium_carterae.3